MREPLADPAFDRTVDVLPGDPHFDRVMEIRRAAYGARLGVVPTYVVRDEYDERARVLLAFIGDAAVGTLRVCLAPERLPFDYAVYAGHRAAWPPLEWCVTMSRVALMPSHQRRGLLRPLQALAIDAARAARRTYVVAGADVRLLPAYERLGWKRTGSYRSNLGPASEFMTMAVDTGEPGS